MVSPEVNPYEKCVGCAVLCDFASKLAVLNSLKTTAQTMGQRMMEDDPALLEVLSGGDLSEDESRELLQNGRRMMGDGIASLDDRITFVEKKIDAHAKDCDGVLKMRASKGDKTYTVSVCTSPLVSNEGQSHRQTHIKVSPAKK